MSYTHILNISIMWHTKPHISISHIDIGDKLCLKYTSSLFLAITVFQNIKFMNERMYVYENK